MSDSRIVYGARCTWWDSIERAAATASGLPCCPHCGSPLFEQPDEATWWAGVDAYEANQMPGYREIIEWARGQCIPQDGRGAVAALVEAYESREVSRQSDIDLDERQLDRIARQVMSNQEAAAVVAEVRRLQDRHEDDVSRLMLAGHENGALRARVAELEAGIREHRDHDFPAGDFAGTQRFEQAMRVNERLWSLLSDSQEDDRG